MNNGRSVVKLKKDAWKKAGEEAYHLNGWVWVAILFMLALGAGF